MTTVAHESVGNGLYVSSPASLTSKNVRTAPLRPIGPEQYATGVVDMFRDFASGCGREVDETRCRVAAARFLEAERLTAQRSGDMRRAGFLRVAWGAVVPAGEQMFEAV